MAGDPILLAMHGRRYKAFYYCNSVAFVASLVAIIMVQKGLLVWHHMLEVAMALELFGLMGAYVAGSYRDVQTSTYIMALFGAVLVYFLIHIILFTLNHEDRSGESNDDLHKLLEKRRKWLLLFEILAAAFTYQAGLSPPGDFLLQDDESGGHLAGGSMLRYYFPLRYKVFFYCNSASFMVSMALIILLTNTYLYRAVIRSNVLSVFTAAGLFCLMGAFAAGGTQNTKTSFYMLPLVAVVLFFVVRLSVVFLLRSRKKSSGIIGTPAETSSTEERTAMEEEGKRHARRKYLMMLGILVASVTYKAGLKPPGGTWLSSYDGDGYEAGNPVMHDKRRTRYLVFFYGNSTSFVASIVVIAQLLRTPLQESQGWLTVIDTTILLDLVALLGAYIAGSSRGWETSACFVAVIIVVLGCLAIPTALSFCCSRNHATQQEGQHGSQEIPPQSLGQPVEVL
jgi:hypothetical protein